MVNVQTEMKIFMIISWFLVNTISLRNSNCTQQFFSFISMHFAQILSNLKSLLLDTVDG